MINQFDRQTLRVLRADLEAAIKAVAAKHNVMLDLGGMSFDAGSVSCRLKGLILSQMKHSAPIGTKIPGLVNTQGSTGFHGTGIKEGTAFLFRGTKFTITAIKPSRPKFPFVAQNDRGTKYKWSLTQVQAGLIK